MPSSIPDPMSEDTPTDFPSQPPSPKQEENGFDQAWQHTQEAPQTQTQEYYSPPLEEEEEYDPSVWGILHSLNPVYVNVLLTKSVETDDTYGSGRAGGYLLGRHRECDIVFQLTQVSNRHCLIFKENRWNDHTKRIEECIFIEDMSTNGTYINKHKIKKMQPYRLSHGDEIQLAIYDVQKYPQFFDDRFYMFQLPKRMRQMNVSGEGIHDKYLITRDLGSGNFATVKLAINRHTGEKFAVKVIKKQKLRSRPKFLENLQQEISILMALNHPNIISIYGVFDEADYVYIVLELVPGGELFDAISLYRGFSEDVTRNIFIQLFRALKYLHDRGISHRDLKPENILMVNAPPTNDFTIKISDFGLAKLAGDASFFGTLCGTPNYVAPEVLKPEHGKPRQYTNKVDMWSAGVILYICLCGFPPFSDELAPPSMVEQIKQGKFKFLSPWWNTVSEEAKDLVCALLTVDPNKRLSADEALEHPWMRHEVAQPCDPPNPVRYPTLISFLRGTTDVSGSKVRKRQTTPEIKSKRVRYDDGRLQVPGSGTTSVVPTPRVSPNPSVVGMEVTKDGSLAGAAENSRGNTRVVSDADSVLTDTVEERAADGVVPKGGEKKHRRRSSGTTRNRERTPELNGDKQEHGVRRSGRSRKARESL